MHGLQVGPLIIRRIVEQIPSAQYDSHADPERFTLREAVAHLADAQGISTERIRQTLESPGSTIVPYDEVVRAEEQGYIHSFVMEQLELFDRRRSAVLELLGGLAPDDWGKSAVHTERGVMTVYDQANLLLAHDTYHIEHLTQFLSN